MIPYSRLKMTMSNCPVGFSFALSKMAVTPISDAISVKSPFPPKRQKDKTISATEKVQRNNSKGRTER